MIHGADDELTPMIWRLDGFGCSHMADLARAFIGLALWAHRKAACGAAAIQREDDGVAITLDDGGIGMYPTVASGLALLARPIGQNVVVPWAGF